MSVINAEPAIIRDALHAWESHWEMRLNTANPLSAHDTFLANEQDAALRQQLGPRGQGYGAIGQINPAPGDLAGNARKILTGMRAAEAIGLDWVAFPELALMGYPIDDVIMRHPFLVQENIRWLQALAERCGQTRALVGFVEPRDMSRPGITGRPFYNAVAVLGNGRLEAIVRKRLLPTYSEFYDSRVFEPADRAGCVVPPDDLQPKSARYADTEPVTVVGPWVQIHGKHYGLMICEDMWNDAEFFDPPLYAVDPVAELMGQGHGRPDALINLSASPSRSRKEQMKHHLIAHVARKYAVPLVYVNQVGAVDEISFDGSSRAYDASGELFSRLPAFASHLGVLNPLKRSGTIAPLPSGRQQSLTTPRHFDGFSRDDLARTYQSIRQGIRDYFAKTGFQRALLGLSGGLDSSVTAVLLADALGADNVLGVSMPTGITSPASREDAQILTERLGIHCIETPIDSAVTVFSEMLAASESAMAQSACWGSPVEPSFAHDNMQAMSRATLLRLLGNQYRALPIATSDKSELYMGYATVNGDMSGALAPLADVPKTKVRLLAEWLNTHREQAQVIPERILERPSGAELALDPVTGQPITAEDVLMPYGFADEIIWRLETLGQSKTEMLDEPFQYETRHTVSVEQKRQWLDRFFRRMAAAVFKWRVLPPAIMVAGNGSITRTDYRHPITAGRIVWDGTSTADIAAQLGPVPV